MLHSTKSTSFW